MFYIKKIIICLLILSCLSAKTPFEYTIGITGGDDNNILRFSSEEFDQAEIDEIVDQLSDSECLNEIQFGSLDKGVSSSTAKATVLVLPDSMKTILDKKNKTIKLIIKNNDSY